MKYTTVKLQGVITRIVTKTDTSGYTVGVLEPFFPSDTDLLIWTEKQHREWIKKNNKMMTDICDFLNKKGDHNGT